MGTILVDSKDDTLRLTLRALVEHAGHDVSFETGEAAVTDSIDRALALCTRCPTLVLVGATRADAAVAAMRKGVYGYALLPLVPGEIEVMLQRALTNGAAAPGDEAMLSLAELERRHIRETLRRCHNNQAQAARVLGIGRNTLWRKLKQCEPEGT